MQELVCTSRLPGSGVKNGVRFLLILVFAALFAGRASHAVEGRKEAGSPILATVNGVPITEAERDRALALALRQNEKLRPSDELKKHVLDELITLLLIEQRLRRTGILQKPSVQDEIEFARRATLKNIFIEQEIGQKTDVTAEDIDKFVAEHPDFFANRKVYYYSDLKITREPRIDAARIKGVVLNANSKTPEQNQAAGGALAPILGYLQAVGADFTSYRGYRNSEQIDPGVLKDLSTLTPGKSVVNDTTEPGYIHVVELISSQPDPADPIQMRPQIARGMAAERSKKTIENLLSKMRAEGEVKFGADAAKAVRRKPSSQVMSEQGPGEFHQPASMATKAALAWIFALLVLAPAALLRFHLRTVAQRGELFLLDHDTVSALKNRLTLFSYTPLFEMAWVLVVAIFFVATSSIILHSGLPLMTGATLALLATAGIGVALSVCALLSHYSGALPSAIEKSRWAPIATIASLHFAGLLVVGLTS